MQFVSVALQNVLEAGLVRINETLLHTLPQDHLLALLPQRQWSDLNEVNSLTIIADEPLY